ncbi:hypothetical protein DJ564_18055 [Pseudomonas sp. 31-12]|uniref:hypothetical protein n=1 Tax=Pseudomonas sp. 31-12 TaxID=2201356 RepID=UPI000D6B5FA2|nr:hypothetical protein [Pseudomonas sp. 31-12]AWM92578.1 hypothetical protein DJ564_18055 [Pseudomonas sp. 31-12]
MSQQSEKDNSNLLLNGNFLNGGTHWNPNSQAKVRFEEGHCALQVDALITQRVEINAEGDFEFSVRMKTDSGSACRATLELLPSNQTVHFNIGGGIPWTKQEQIVNAPAGTTEMIVTLSANDGTRGEFGSCFDFALLIPLSN